MKVSGADRGWFNTHSILDAIYGQDGFLLTPAAKLIIGRYNEASETY